MKLYRYIVALSVVVAGLALSARADDYVDDVYYWDTPQRTQSAPLFDNDNNETEEYQEPQEGVADTSASNRQTEITFIEDSVTRNDATVIKAVIKRQ